MNIQNVFYIGNSEVENERPSITISYHRSTDFHNMVSMDEYDLENIDEGSYYPEERGLEE